MLKKLGHNYVLIWLCGIPYMFYNNPQMSGNREQLLDFWEEGYPIFLWCRILAAQQFGDLLSFLFHNVQNLFS